MPRLLAALAVVILTGLALPRPALAAGEDGVDFISVDEVRRLQETPRRILLVDVRTADEYRQSRIAGAVNVPVVEIERRFGEIPRQGLVVLH